MYIICATYVPTTLYTYQSLPRPKQASKEKKLQEAQQPSGGGGWWGWATSWVAPGGGVSTTTTTAAEATVETPTGQYSFAYVRSYVGGWGEVSTVEHLLN